MNKSNTYTSYERKSVYSNDVIPTKTLQDLNMMDSFLFEAATEDMENAKKIAKIIIRRATGHLVENLIVESQKQLKGLSLDNHGIRMDLYMKETFSSDKNASTLRLYDIEPNKYYEKDLPRRSRYYQSLMDSKLLQSKSRYQHLPDMITIWILPYDPFGDDRMIYTIKNMVVENSNLVYNDGITKIILYTKGTKGGSKELKDLLTYLENTTLSNAVDKELQELQEIVNNVKGREDVGGRYMTLQEMIDYEKRDSYEDGLKEGLKDGLDNGIKCSINVCKSLNLDRTQTKDKLLEQFSLTEEQTEEYLNLYW